MDTAQAVHAWLMHHDEHAARWLVDSHAAAVASVARRWIPREALVEDVVQDVFIRIFATLPRFDPARPFFPWLLRITRNTCARHLRCWRRRRAFAACEHPLASVPEETLPTSLQTASAQALHELEEDRAARSALIQQLPKRDRELLLLLHEEGLSAEEAGQTLGISAGNVRIRAHRARQRLSNAALIGSKRIPSRQAGDPQVHEAPGGAARGHGRFHLLHDAVV